MDKLRRYMLEVGYNEQFIDKIVSETENMVAELELLYRWDEFVKKELE